MESTGKNIYPLTEENLQALLTYFFPNSPRGNLKDVVKELNNMRISLHELEYSFEKILPLISVITEKIGDIPTQTNILDYSVESFLDQEYCNYNIDGERREIINLLRERAGVIASQEYTINVRKKLFTVRSWN
ncbi:MAG: hypothetical protein JSW63_02260 [Ignavibacterium sp.]|nr:MAG: hypothetical protein JSW63_02260 [Ignavibacterium sp.]